MLFPRKSHCLSLRCLQQDDTVGVNRARRGIQRQIVHAQNVTQILWWKQLAYCSTAVRQKGWQLRSSSCSTSLTVGVSSMPLTSSAPCTTGTVACACSHWVKRRLPVETGFMVQYHMHIWACCVVTFVGRNCLRGVMKAVTMSIAHAQPVTEITSKLCSAANVRLDV